MMANEADGLKTKPRTVADVARMMNLRKRGLERAAFVLRYGVPELAALVEAGHLHLLPASWLARLSHAQQREVITTHAPKELVLIATAIRQEVEREGGRGLRDLRRVWERAAPADRLAFRAWLARQLAEES